MKGKDSLTYLEKLEMHYRTGALPSESIALRQLIDFCWRENVGHNSETFEDFTLQVFGAIIDRIDLDD